MSSKRTEETERLYAEGMLYFRSGQWERAVQTFSQVQAMSSAYPEADTLIADAMLKIEVERSKTPQEVLPPPKKRSPVPWATALAAVLLLGGGLTAGGMFLLNRPEPEPTAQPVRVAEVPTVAPTPTPLPPPTPTEPLPPTNTPSPGSGTVQVRMADGYTLTRSIQTIEIILDASGSMSGLIDGREKIDIAHGALSSLIEQLPDTTQVALRAYGHRRTGDCGDIELVAPLQPVNRAGLIETITRVRPAQRGRTPMAQALQQVAGDFQGVSGEKLVVLVSDGDETCDGNPVQVAEQLRAIDPFLRVSVIGFDVGQEEAWRQRLSDIARAGGGSYFDAANATQLVSALQQAVSIQYRIFDEYRALLYEGELGSTALLPKGSYRIEVNSTPKLVIPIEIEDGKTKTVAITDENGVLAASELVP